VVERYGPPEVAEVRDVPTPLVRADEVLVRVAAVAVTSGDARIRGARFPRGFAVPARLALGLRGPRRPVLGSALSGTVVEAGSAVASLAPGDAVAGMCGARMGAHAELVAVRADRLVPKPYDVPHAAAAGVLFGGTTALHFLRDRVRPGTTVLVNGAAGAVGTSAVQIATLLGGEVTAVAGASNHDLVTRLGARAVVDHRATRLADLGRTFDVVLDAVGVLDRRTGSPLLAPAGTLVLVAATLAQTVGAAGARGRVVAGPSSERPDHVTELLDHLVAGRLDPVTRTLPGLGSAVEAHRVVDSGRKVGNLVLHLDDPAA
jgi:NADPH:quinone reductase-like Zn-dependent oxidoreductase